MTVNPVLAIGAVGAKKRLPEVLSRNQIAINLTYRTMYNYVNSRLQKFESRFGPTAASVAVGIVLFLAACIYVRPGIQASTGLGQFYAELARHPFFAYTTNLVGYRFLTPLISYSVGLRGELIIVTNLIIAALFIMVVYRCFRKLSEEPADAFIAASVVAFSLVTLTTIYYSGFCDSLTYLIIFLMWWWRRHTMLFWFLFLLGMFNRESILFLLPWFLYIRLDCDANRRRRFLFDILAIVLVAAIVIWVRDWQSGNMRVTYDTEFYLGPLTYDPLFYFRSSFPESILGFATVFKLLWAIPVVWLASQWRGDRKTFAKEPIILLVCSGLQLLIAWDSSRLWTMSFMVVLIALQQMFQSPDKSYRSWIFILLVLNFIAPAYYTAEHTVEHMRLLPDTLYRVFMLGKGY